MKTILTICIVSAVGLGSVANAQNLLTNADAEDGSLWGWSVDLGSPSAATDCDGIGAFFATVESGIFSFSMNQCDSDAEAVPEPAEAAQISQEVDITGCNVTTSVGELTGGRYDFSTRYLYGSDAQATYGLSFSDAEGNLIESTNSAKSGSPGFFQSGSISGAIPAGASTATVLLGGTGINQPNAWHDNVSFELSSCVAAYTVAAGKTTCKAGREVVSNEDGDTSAETDCGGKNGTPSFAIMSSKGIIKFDGAVFLESQMGLMDESGVGEPETFPFTGKITEDSFVLITSKNPSPTAWCLFKPYPGMGTSITITDRDWFMSPGSFMRLHCEAKNGVVIKTIWPVPMGQISGQGGKGKNKDRGTFWLGSMEFPLTRGNSGTFRN